MPISELEFYWAIGRKRVEPPTPELDDMARTAFKTGESLPFKRLPGELTIRIKRKDDKRAIGFDVDPLSEAIKARALSGEYKSILTQARKRLGVKLVDRAGPTSIGDRVIALANVVYFSRWVLSSNTPSY